MGCEDLCAGISRRKTLPLTIYARDKVGAENVIDLILFGLGSTFGYGIYFLVGQVARTTGPVAIVSVAFAGVSAMLASFCYLEFSSRLPKGTSPYFNTYFEINEFMAFTFGWNILLEYAIGAASLARGLSSFYKFQIYEQRSCYSKGDIFSCHHDVEALGIVLLVTLICTFWLDQWPKINAFITVLNLVTIFMIVIVGITVYDESNWKISKSNDTTTIGNGGFMPFNINSIFFAAAKYVYLFIGLGCITAAGQNVIRPRITIPSALVVCLVFTFVLHMLVTACLTLVVPYYTLDPVSPIIEAFMFHDMIIIKWIVTGAAIMAISNGMFCCQFIVSRVIYTMGVDGILSRCLGRINKRTGTAANAIIFCGCVSAVAALIFDVDDLIELTSLVTLWIRCMCAMFIIMINYRPVQEVVFANVTCWRIFKHLIIYSDFDEPNKLTADIVFYAMITFTILSIIMSALMTFSFLIGDHFEGYKIAICGVIVYFMIHTIILMARQPKPNDTVNCKVPWSPIVPCLSIFLNIMLMMHLHFLTWIRLIFWMAIGFLIYFCYGIKQSSEIHRSRVNLMENRPSQNSTGTTDTVTGIARPSKLVPNKIVEIETVLIDLHQADEPIASKDPDKPSTSKFWK